MIIWLTGFSGSGKSTLAKKLAERISKCKILDGDEIRKTISKDLGFSEEDRKENILRVIKRAKNLQSKGWNVIVALMSPYRKLRKMARDTLKDFFEVYVKCPIAICKRRDPKSLYEKFEKGKIKNISGLDLPYEAPEDPEIVVETDKETIEESVVKIMQKVSKTIVVLGQRRSGTSMLSGILYYLGIPVGATPSQRTWVNPKGFFEDREIIKISEEILNYFKEHPGVSERELDELFGKKIEKTINKKLRDIWAFKDVNQVVLHKLYQKYIPNPRYLIIFRNPFSIVRSLKRWFSETNFWFYFDFVRFQTSSLMKLTLNLAESYPLLLLSYERSLEEPEKTVDEIIQFLGIKVTKRRREKAIAHISPEIKHF